MPRTYNARITGLIVGVQPKWLDNLLSRYDLPGVARSRQGVERRLTDDGILAVELCRILNLELGLSLAQSATIASQCVRDVGAGELRHTTASGLVVSLPLPVTRVRLRDRAMEAVDMVAAARRGRPPRRR